MSEGRLAKDWGLGPSRRMPGCGARSHAALLRVIWRPATGAVSCPQRVYSCMSSKWTLCWENATGKGNCSPTEPVVRKEGRRVTSRLWSSGSQSVESSSLRLLVAALCLAPALVRNKLPFESSWQQEKVSSFSGEEKLSVFLARVEKRTLHSGGLLEIQMDASPRIWMCL